MLKVKDLSGASGGGKIFPYLQTPPVRTAREMTFSNLTIIVHDLQSMAAPADAEALAEKLQEVVQACAAGDTAAAAVAGFELGCAIRDASDRLLKAEGGRRSGRNRREDAAWRQRVYRTMALAIWNRNPRLDDSRVAEFILAEINGMPKNDRDKLSRSHQVIRKSIKRDNDSWYGSSSIPNP